MSGRERGEQRAAGQRAARRKLRPICVLSPSSCFSTLASCAFRTSSAGSIALPLGLMQDRLVLSRSCHLDAFAPKQQRPPPGQAASRKLLPLAFRNNLSRCIQTTGKRTGGFSGWSEPNSFACSPTLASQSQKQSQTTDVSLRPTRKTCLASLAFTQPAAPPTRESRRGQTRRARRDASAFSSCRSSSYMRLKSTRELVFFLFLAWDRLKSRLASSPYLRPGELSTRLLGSSSSSPLARPKSSCCRWRK